MQKSPPLGGDFCIKRVGFEERGSEWSAGGNCGAAPPGADEAAPQFPQPRRFASLSLYGEVRKRHCGKAVVRAEPGPARSSGNPTEVRQKKDCYFNKVAILFNMQCCLNGRNMLTFSIDTFEMAYSFIRTMLGGLS